MSRNPLRNRWHKMISRCEVIGSSDYENWGGKGVKVCPEWHNFDIFEKWAYENGYEENLTLDRIDVEGNYCPENCRWITIEEQQRNRRNTIKVTWQGETLATTEWDERLGFPSGTIRQRLRRKWSVERAMTQPLGVKQYNYTNNKGTKNTVVILPNGEKRIYPSIGQACKDIGITPTTLRSIAKEGDTVPRRKWKGYKVFIDVVVSSDYYTEKEN